MEDVCYLYTKDYGSNHGIPFVTVHTHRYEQQRSIEMLHLCTGTIMDSRFITNAPYEQQTNLRMCAIHLTLSVSHVEICNL